MRTFQIINRYAALTGVLIILFSFNSVLTGDEQYGENTVRNYHQTKGVTCELCHMVKSPVNPASSQSCSWCHGSSQFMATTTTHLNPNPHNSVHWGYDLECDMCHKSHEESVNYCDTCHHSDLVVP